MIIRALNPKKASCASVFTHALQAKFLGYKKSVIFREIFF